MNHGESFYRERYYCINGENDSTNSSATRNENKLCDTRIGKSKERSKQCNDESKNGNERNECRNGRSEKGTRKSNISNFKSEYPKTRNSMDYEENKLVNCLFNEYRKKIDLGSKQTIYKSDLESEESDKEAYHKQLNAAIKSKPIDIVPKFCKKNIVLNGKTFDYQFGKNPFDRSSKIDNDYDSTNESSYIESSFESDDDLIYPLSSDDPVSSDENSSEQSTNKKRTFKTFSKKMHETRNKNNSDESDNESDDKIFYNALSKSFTKSKVKYFENFIKKNSQPDKLTKPGVVCKEFGLCDICKSQFWLYDHQKPQQINYSI